MNRNDRGLVGDGRPAPGQHPVERTAGLVILILAVKLVWTCATFAFTRIALRLVQRA
jgi:hypothetical protein